MFSVQVNMDNQNIMDLVKSINEDTPSSSKLLSDKNKVLDKGRQKKSLSSLTIKFAEFLRNSPDGVINLNKVIELL